MREAALLLMSGTASEVFGIESETWLRKTVRLRRTVTSATNNNEDQEKIRMKMRRRFI